MIGDGIEGSLNEEGDGYTLGVVGEGPGKRRRRTGGRVGKRCSSVERKCEKQKGGDEVLNVATLAARDIKENISTLGTADTR